MTQVSLYGDFPLDLDVDPDQSGSDNDDEDQKEELKKALEAFGDETFDLGSEFDDDEENDSRSSSVNQSHNDRTNDTGNSILSNTDKNSSATAQPQKQTEMNGNVRFGALLNGGHVSSSSPSPSPSGSPFLNGMNLDMLPNSVFNNSSENRANASGKVNGNVGSHASPPLVNGHGIKLNGNLINGNANLSSSILKNSFARPKKQVTIVEQTETIREQEEIEASNPTISFHHKEHCPRMEKDGYVNDDMWLAAERSEEQLKSMLQIRERQIQQGEQEIGKLQKDKRALNHQIGLMKTELVQMRSKQEEFENYKKVKEQEIEFMRSKMRETIAEFEKAKENEIAAADHIKFLNDEIEKYKQEVQLLSSIGSSVKQVEINDVVRQLREKHAAELVSWKKQVMELQGHLRTYKRQQQLLTDESFNEQKVEKNDASCQTVTEQLKSPSKSSVFLGAGDNDSVRRKEMTQIAILSAPDQDDLIIKEKKLISLNEKFEELKREFQEEREQKELEIREYRERLARLPAELYQRWEETQRELGLKATLDLKPICVDAFTCPMEPEEINLGLEPSAQTRNFFADLRDAEVQVDLVPTNTVSENTSTPQIHAVTSFSPHLDISRNTSSVLIQTEKEPLQEVNTQTDETLETFNELGILISSWHRELLESKENEEELKGKCQEYEEKCHEFQTALNKYHKQFKVLQKVATKCRKESKKREEDYKKEIADLKEHQREVLMKLTEKLDILA